MLKKGLKKFGGAIILYCVIFIGIVAINARFTSITNNTSQISINK